MERIEEGLVPRVANSMTQIQAVVVEAMQQSQTVQKMLQDLNSKQTYDAERRQIAFMEDIRRQLREVIDAQVGVALKDFGDKLDRKFDELKELKRRTSPRSCRQPGKTQGPRIPGIG
jgi:hypothetical protein